MIAKKCDRCGKFYEQYNVKSDSKNINGLCTMNIDSRQRYYSHELIDLCQDCSTELINWLKNDVTDI